MSATSALRLTTCASVRRLFWDERISSLTGVFPSRSPSICTRCSCALRLPTFKPRRPVVPAAGLVPLCVRAMLRPPGPAAIQVAGVGPTTTSVPRRPCLHEAVKQARPPHDEDHPHASSLEGCMRAPGERCRRRRETSAVYGVTRGTAACPDLIRTRASPTSQKQDACGGRASIPSSYCLCRRLVIDDPRPQSVQTIPHDDARRCALCSL